MVLTYTQRRTPDHALAIADRISSHAEASQAQADCARGKSNKFAKNASRYVYDCENEEPKNDVKCGARFIITCGHYFPACSRPAFSC